MNALWQAAFGVAGVGGVVAFVLWSVFTDVLQAPALNQILTKEQIYKLLRLVLIFTFLFAMTGLGAFAFHNADQSLTISGTVLTIDGDLVPGALVVVAGLDRQNRTEDNGFFTITLNDSPAGDSVTLVVTPPASSGISVRVAIGTGLEIILPDTLGHSITANEWIRVHGFITNESRPGRSLPEGLQVVIKLDQETLIAAVQRSGSEVSFDRIIDPMVYLNRWATVEASYPDWSQTEEVELHLNAVRLFSTVLYLRHRDDLAGEARRAGPFCMSLEDLYDDFVVEDKPQYLIDLPYLIFACHQFGGSIPATTYSMIQGISTRTPFTSLEAKEQGEVLRGVGNGLKEAQDQSRTLRGVTIYDLADELLGEAIEIAPNNALGYIHRYELRRAEGNVHDAMKVIHAFFEGNAEVTRESSVERFLNDWGAMLSEESGVADWYQDGPVADIDEEIVNLWRQLGPLLESYSHFFANGRTSLDKSLRDVRERWERVVDLHGPT